MREVAGDGPNGEGFHGRLTGPSRILYPLTRAGARHGRLATGRLRPEGGRRVPERARAQVDPGPWPHAARCPLPGEGCSLPLLDAELTGMLQQRNDAPHAARRALPSDGSTPRAPPLGRVPATRLGELARPVDSRARPTRSREGHAPACSSEGHYPAVHREARPAWARCATATQARTRCPVRVIRGWPETHHVRACPCCRGLCPATARRRERNV